MARGRDWSDINPRVEARLGYRRMDPHRLSRRQFASTDGATDDARREGVRVCRA